MGRHPALVTAGRAEVTSKAVMMKSSFAGLFTTHLDAKYDIIHMILYFRVWAVLSSISHLIREPLERTDIVFKVPPPP